MLFESSTILALLFASTALAALPLQTLCTKDTQGEDCIRCPIPLAGAELLCYAGKCKTRRIPPGKRVSYDILEVSAGEMKADSHPSLLL
jgi:hypothetical protein